MEMHRPRLSLDGGETWHDLQSADAAWSQKPGGEREALEPMETTFTVPFTPHCAGILPGWPGWSVLRKTWRTFWPLSYAWHYRTVDVPAAPDTDEGGGG